MVTRTDFEKTATTIASLNASELIRRISGFRGRFRLDFTEEYLKGQTTDRLRHILLAALVAANSHN